VAFDDPYSAVATIGLTERVAGRRARLLVEPVVNRGIPGRPAVADKRRYALRRPRAGSRARRSELSRTDVVAPEATRSWPPDRAAAGPAARGLL